MYVEQVDRNILLNTTIYTPLLSFYIAVKFSYSALITMKRADVYFTAIFSNVFPLNINILTIKKDERC